MINSYCGFEAGVRNLRKCIDRVFRKIVAKLEKKKIVDAEAAGLGGDGLETNQLQQNDAATAGHYLN